MQYPALYTFLNSIGSFTEQELDEISSLLSARKIRKREFLLREGEICHEAYFVTKGILRNMISSRSGEELTTYFTVENNFVIEYASFNLNKPSLYSIQALENGEVIVFSRNAIENIYENFKDGNKLGRLVAEYHFIKIVQKLVISHTYTVEERYREFNELYPDIFNRVPLYMIASFLGISRMHLNRLRSKTGSF